MHSHRHRTATRYGCVVFAAVAFALLLSAERSLSQGCDDTPDHFTFTSNTGNNYAIVLDSTSVACALSECDEVGVFDGNLCVGASVFQGQWPLAITAWENDPQTGSKDGYKPGNTMSFKLWDGSEGSEVTTTPHYVQGDGTFGAGAYAQLWLDCAAPDGHDGVSLDHVVGLLGTDTVECGVPVQIFLRITNEIGGELDATADGSTNGFRLFSPDGATWQPAGTYGQFVDPGGGLVWNGSDPQIYDGGIFVNTFSTDGAGADTIGFAGFVQSTGTGIEQPFDEVSFEIALAQVDCSSAGRTLCLDSSYYPPTSEWIWSAQGGSISISPPWDGPHCWTIFEPTSGEFTTSKDSLYFPDLPDGSVDDRTFLLASTGDPINFNVDIRNGSSWLTVTPTSGVTSTTITVSVDPNLASGQVADTLDITGATKVSPIEIPVYFNADRVCTDDQYEENDARETAAPLQEQIWLTAVQGDDDYYEVTVPSGSEHVSVDCQFTHAGGNIDIELQDALGGVVTSSKSTTDNELIDTCLDNSGTYYIRVFGSNSCNEYSLMWEGDSCLACDDTPDHFTFTSNTGNNYAIVLDSTSVACALSECDEVGVFDGDLCVGASVFQGQWPLAITAWEDDTQTGSKDGYKPGNTMSFRLWDGSQGSEVTTTPHYVQGDGTFGLGAFAQLWVSCVPPATGEFTTSKDSLYFPDFPGGSVDDRTFLLGSTGDPINFNIDIRNGSSWLTVTPTSGVTSSTITVSVDPNLASGQVADTLDITGATKVSPIEIPIYFNVDSVACTEDQYEENDIRSAAKLLQEQTWITAVQGDDDYYEITVPSGSEHVSVDCQFTHATGNIDIELQDALGDVVTSSTSTTDSELIDTCLDSSGAYYIRVFGSNSCNDYSLRWEGDSCLVFTTTGLTDDSLYFPDVSDGTTEPRAFELGSDGDLLDFNIAIRNDAAWLTVSPMSGTTPQTITVDVDPEAVDGIVYDTLDITGSAKAAAIEIPVYFDEPSDVQELEGNVPISYTLGQNYPNPFNPSTLIRFSLPEAAVVNLTIYNAIGQRIRTLVNKPLGAGQYEVDWDGTNAAGVEVASGIYFYKLQTEHYVETKRMMLLK